MKPQRKWPLVVIVSLVALPFIPLIAAGGMWFWQQDYYRMWLWMLLSCLGLAWIVGNLYVQRMKADPFPKRFSLPKDAVLSQQDKEVWKSVEALADEFYKRDERPNLECGEYWLAIGREVLGKVAKAYKPKASYPELDVPVSGMLMVFERVARDVRTTLDEMFPGSHMITLNDVLVTSEWLKRIQEINTSWRFMRMVLNPVGALMPEAINIVKGKVIDNTLPFFHKWLLDFYIKKIGYYGILLYSGKLIERYTPVSESVQNSPMAEMAKGPLSILVAGQVKAGKSTLINALLGELRAPVNVIPCTDAIQPYSLTKEGIVEGYIYDSPGYGETTSWLKGSKEQLDKIDMLLLVCSVNNAAREADKRFLAEFAEYFKDKLQRIPPPVVVVATYIDQLRPFTEWNPPYNLASPSGDKEKNINKSLHAIETELELTPIVPVSLTKQYNLDILWMVIADSMDEATKTMMLRKLEDHMKIGKYSTLAKQFINGGRFIFSKTNKAIS